MEQNMDYLTNLMRLNHANFMHRILKAYLNRWPTDEDYENMSFQTDNDKDYLVFDGRIIGEIVMEMEGTTFKMTFKPIIQA